MDKEKEDNQDDSGDPFKAIGVEELNPKKLLDEIENENNHSHDVNELNTIEDLPGFLKTSKLSDEELMEVLSRFLLQDDVTLKQYGAVYDKTGFDGVKEIKELPLIEEERNTIRAKSAATVYVSVYRLSISRSLKNLKFKITISWEFKKPLRTLRTGEFIELCLLITKI